MTAVTHKVLGLTDAEYEKALYELRNHRPRRRVNVERAKKLAASVLYRREAFGKVMALIAFLHEYSMPRGGMTLDTYNRVQDMSNRLESSWLYSLRDVPKRGVSPTWQENKAPKMRKIDGFMASVIGDMWPNDEYLAMKVQENRKRWASRKMPNGPNRKPGPKPGKRRGKVAKTPSRGPA